MTDRLQGEHHTAGLHETEIRSGRWRNLWFTDSGRTYWSHYVFDTHAECLIFSAWWLGEARAYIEAGGEDPEVTWSGDLVPVPAFLFAIPMPWRD